MFSDWIEVAWLALAELSVDTWVLTQWPERQGASNKGLEG